MKMGILAALATVFATQTVSAATLDLEYVGAASGYSGVTINQSPITPAGNDYTVIAGGFEMSSDETGILSNFIAWCLDLGAYLGTDDAYPYKVTDTPFSIENGGQVMDAATQSRISKVFSANYTDAVPLSTNSSAAFQLALWEALYDTDMNLDTGDFQATADDDDVADLAAIYLDAADNASDSSIFKLTFLQSTSDNRRQNLVTASPIPLPASSLLLIAGLGGIAGLKRFRK